MSKPKITHFEALDVDDIDRAHALPQSSHFFIQIPLNGPGGECLDNITVPADPEFIVRSFLIARAESPYDVNLWIRQYEDGTVIFTFIDREDIPHFIEMAQRERDAA